MSGGVREQAASWTLEGSGDRRAPILQAQVACPKIAEAHVYEFEANHGRRRELSEPEQVRQEVESRETAIRALAVIPWEEHCTECAIPACYESCALYQAR